MNEVLTPSQLKRLTEHKYSVEGSSICDPVMQKFWGWLIQQIPLHWAPNAITLAGLIVNIVTATILVIYSPDARQQVPAWPLVLNALGLFIYQSLDAIDGKQARRTKSSSPLGELFDHGCDALSTVFVAVSINVAIEMGHHPEVMFMLTFIGYFLYYLAHWQTYVTGTLRFGKFDVTEGQWIVVGLCLTSALFGTDFWSMKIPILGVEIKILFMVFTLVAAFLSFQMNFRIIFFEGGCGKNGSTTADTSIVFPIIPFAIVSGLGLAIWKKSTSHLFELHPCLYLISFGMAVAKITCKLIVGHMTKSEISLLDSTLIGPGMLFFNQYFNTVFNEYLVLWMCFFYCTVDLFCYSSAVCCQICDFLNIFCFKIKPPSQMATPTHTNISNSGATSKEHGSDNDSNGQSSRTILTRSMCQK